MVGVAAYLAVVVEASVQRRQHLKPRHLVHLVALSAAVLQLDQQQGLEVVAYLVVAVVRIPYLAISSSHKQHLLVYSVQIQQRVPRPLARLLFSMQLPRRIQGAYSAVLKLKHRARHLEDLAQIQVVILWAVVAVAAVA